MTAQSKDQPRLVLLCGLPASGKTALAREIADAYGAVRLDPDAWELALAVDPFDEAFQARLEAQFWELAQRLLVLGTPAVELRFLDVPFGELVRRVVARHAAGGIGITEAHMERYRGMFQPPTEAELALYDPPLEQSAP
jgi:predicted kinase